MIVGVSGGLDSAVVAFLGVKALGPNRIHGLFLPDRDTASENHRHAMKVAAAAGFSLETINLTPILSKMGCYNNIIVKFARNRLINRIGFQAFRKITNKDLYEFNLKGSDNKLVNQAAELYYLRYKTRMRILYDRSRKDGLLLPDSLNKTENLIGFTVYDDINVDFAPILPLYKSQVRTLAAYLGVPQEIICKPPSPDLFPGITDEIFLNISYELLDSIIFLLKKGVSENDISLQCNITEKQVKRINHLMELASRLNSQLNIPCPDLA